MKQNHNVSTASCHWHNDNDPPCPCHLESNRIQSASEGLELLTCPDCELVSDPRPIKGKCLEPHLNRDVQEAFDGDTPIWSEGL